MHPSAAGANYVWSYNFIEDRTRNGRKLRILHPIDELSHKCLAIKVDRSLNSAAVIDALTDLFMFRRIPGHSIRSWPEFSAKAVRNWIGVVGAKSAFIEPGSPWSGEGLFCTTTGYCESFNSKLRDEP